MSVRTHIQYSDITDFTPGYFSEGSTMLMPPNAAQEMLDCRPDVGGGLRAATKLVEFSNTGIVSTGKCIGLYSRGGIGIQSGGVGDTFDRYVAVYDTATNQVKIYRWNNAMNPTPTSWTLIKTHTAPAATTTPNPVQFDTFVGASGEAYVCWTLAQTSADDGLWYLRFSYQAGQGASAIDEQGVTATRSVTQAISGFCTAVAVQDDRAIVALGASVSTLRWSASQDIVTAWPAANTLTVQASRQGSLIQSITAFAPTDLLIGTRYSAWTMVQGAITDPVVRTMSSARPLGAPQQGVFTTNGVGFISAQTGVFLTGDGQSFTDISQQLAPNIWVNTGNGSVGIGQLAYVGNLLLAPHGLVYDERVQSWYRLSKLYPSTNDSWCAWSNPYDRSIFCATGGSTFKMYTLSTDEGTRYNTYTWKSAPFRRPDGRRIRIRAVEITFKTADANSTVAVTVNGTTHNRTLASAGRQTVEVYFNECADVLDVQVVPSAASSSNEAPIIESIRVGTTARQQVY